MELPRVLRRRPVMLEPRFRPRPAHLMALQAQLGPLPWGLPRLAQAELVMPDAQVPYSFWGRTGRPKRAVDAGQETLF